ncbi:MAG: hypothetical protein IT439_12535 [Phycisphaerales bacterium]|nr:hypothetical protein [Phycisphaerales bacterium]
MVMLVAGVGLSAFARQPQPPLPPGIPVPQVAPEQAPGEGLKALVSMHGPRSAFPEARYVRVMDAETFATMWAMHVGDDPDDNFRASRAYPEIDFTRCMVIAYFRGPSVNNDGEIIDSVTPTGGGIRIRFDSLTYQTMPRGEADRRLSCRPFGIWVLPRDEGEVIIEENTQGLLSQPPVWTRQIRFERFH